MQIRCNIIAEFLEARMIYFGNEGELEVFVERWIRDIVGTVDNTTKDFRLDFLGIGWFRWIQFGLRSVFYIYVWSLSSWIVQYVGLILVLKNDKRLKNKIKQYNNRIKKSHCCIMDNTKRKWNKKVIGQFWNCYYV